MDKLDDLFTKQLNLQEHLGNTKELIVYNQKFINLNILASFDELGEAMRETQWKNPDKIEFGWKKTQQFNDENFKNELVDLLHFFINLCIASGMSANEVYDRYIGKRNINIERKNSGY